MQYWDSFVSNQYMIFNDVNRHIVSFIAWLIGSTAITVANWSNAYEYKHIQCLYIFHMNTQILFGQSRNYPGYSWFQAIILAFSDI